MIQSQDGIQSIPPSVLRGPSGGGFHQPVKRFNLRPVEQIRTGYLGQAIKRTGDLESSTKTQTLLARCNGDTLKDTQMWKRRRGGHR